MLRRAHFATARTRQSQRRSGHVVERGGKTDFVLFVDRPWLTILAPARVRSSHARPSMHLASLLARGAVFESRPVDCNRMLPIAPRGDLMMTPQLQARADGAVSCSDGWAVRFVAPDLLEYSQGQAACLVNVGISPSERQRSIYATESSSELFPQLREHLQSAVHYFKGQYVVV
jgi:hypothetical protein